MAAVDLFLDYQWQARQADALKNRISLIFKKHYPPSAVMVDPVHQLQTKLAEDKKTYGMDDGDSGVTVLELLKDMSGFISPSLDIIITHFHYENKCCSAQRRGKKNRRRDDCKKRASEIEILQKCHRQSTSLAKEGAKVNFDLRIELK